MVRDETSWVEWIRDRVGGGEGVLLGVGDDAAVLDPGARGPLVLASDQCLAGVHFEPGVDPWELVGRKALCRVVSDMAAVAARPWVATVSAALPEGADRDFERLMEGLLVAAREEQTVLVGGDLARSPRGLNVDVNIIGLLEGRRPWRRDGARPGDELYVSGVLGGSRAGHHLRFRPRWREAVRLHASGAITAAIDLSDGLGKDLPRLCQASGVGARVEAEAVPRRVLQGRACSLAAALGDGEDFELLMAVDPGRGPLPEVGVPLHRIGVVTEEGLELRSADGRREPWTDAGFEHFSGGSRPPGDSDAPPGVC